MRLIKHIRREFEIPTMHMISFENIVVFLAFILYTCVSISHFYKHNYAWGVVWGGYAVSNIGLIIAQSIK
jgi:hypothetical protein